VFVEQAPAKINLFLHVGARRALWERMAPS
jgi:4-diphosphocytidyl-2C-methyl-D-erythritol kinase